MTASYTYNALGQRVGKIVNGQGTRFFHDAQGHLLGEYAANGQPIQEIVWLGDWPIGVIKNNTLYNVHTDHLGTPRKISRASDSQVVWTWESEAFGAGAPNQNPSGLGNFVLNLRFPGQYYDAETGLHYNYFRDYDPNHGRYIESDPIGLAGGINTYGYVGGNPVGAVDPLGLTPATHPGNDDLPDGTIGIPAPVVTRPGEVGENDPTPAKDIGEIVEKCLDIIDDIIKPDEPCDPQEGTICSVFHSGETPHKVTDFYGNKLPPQDWHVHTWQMNKSPSGCFWNERRAQKYTFTYTPIDARPCSSYPSWVAQNPNKK